MLKFLWTLEGKKFPKTFFEVLERQDMKDQTIFELYTDDNKYSSNPMNILKSAKKFMKLYTKCSSRAATTEFVLKS